MMAGGIESSISIQEKVMAMKCISASNYLASWITDPAEEEFCRTNGSSLGTNP
jgi:hypothetical protein